MKSTSALETRIQAVSAPLMATASATVASGPVAAVAGAAMERAAKATHAAASGTSLDLSSAATGVAGAAAAGSTSPDGSAPAADARVTARARSTAALEAPARQQRASRELAAVRAARQLRVENAGAARRSATRTAEGRGATHEPSRGRSIGQAARGPGVSEHAALASKTGGSHVRAGATTLAWARDALFTCKAHAGARRQARQPHRDCDWRQRSPRACAGGEPKHCGKPRHVGRQCDGLPPALAGATRGAAADRAGHALRRPKEPGGTRAWQPAAIEPGVQSPGRSAAHLGDRRARQGGAHGERHAGRRLPNAGRTRRAS